MAAYNAAWDGFRALIPISAKTGEGLDELCAEIEKYAEEGPQLFPDGQISDQPERQVMGELLREKLLLCLDKEIPHGVAVEISRFSPSGLRFFYVFGAGKPLRFWKFVI